MTELPVSGESRRPDQYLAIRRSFGGRLDRRASLCRGVGERAIVAPGSIWRPRGESQYIGAVPAARTRPRIGGRRRKVGPTRESVAHVIDGQPEQPSNSSAIQQFAGILGEPRNHLPPPSRPMDSGPVATPGEFGQLDSSHHAIECGVWPRSGERGFAGR